MKILIIGSNGKVGKEIIKLLSTKIEITTISRKKNANKNIKQLICDYHNLEIVKNKIENYYDYIINLLPTSSHSIKKEFQVLNKRFGKYIFFSSFAVYCASTKNIDENSKILKKTNQKYIDRKIEYETFLKKNKQVKSVIIRPTHIYNENSLPSIFSARSNTILYFIKKNKNIIAPINWHANRNFISAKNVVQKLNFILKKKSKKRIYNFSSNLHLSWKELFHIYSSILKIKKLNFFKSTNVSLKKFNKDLFADLKYDKGKNIKIKKNYLTKYISKFDSKKFFIKNIKTNLKKKKFLNSKYHDKKLEKYFLCELSKIKNYQK